MAIEVNEKDVSVESAAPVFTPQEEFWTGQFGDEYILRNNSENLITSNNALFAKILDKTDGVGSVMEFGANIGNNLLAIRQLVPDASLAAVEINQKAVEQLKKIDGCRVFPVSILNFEPAEKFDFVLSKTVLIHINPDKLPAVYKKLYEASNRYICVAEYYNPKPTEVIYRGNKGKLFKRDFAGEMLDTYPSLRLVDYGFVYHRDREYPQDDITWFLLEKSST